ncbi:MAG: helix-turn-helix domain-containing protein [bacterium]
MKNHDHEPILQALRHLLAGPLADAATVRLAEPAATCGEMPHGFHCHDAWEWFCPLRNQLQFVVAGRPAITVPNRHLLIVPPGCLHLSVNSLPQPPDLTLLAMILPGTDNPYGGLSVGSLRQCGGGALSPLELAAWTAGAGAPPGTMMEQVAHALGAGAWGRERALGLLRILVAAYAEVSCHQRRDRGSQDARRVAEAQIHLQSHYYEPMLSVETVAVAVGLSASHLGAIFRKTTGHTLHQTLVNLRFRRANDLLTRTTRSIKEIAALTGWSNQLYFSVAYRRRHGQPPSAVRLAAGPAPKNAVLPEAHK